MSEIRIVSADELRDAVRFEELIEPVSLAFERSSAGLAQNGLFTLFPAKGPDMGDVFVKGGALPGYPVFIVKVSPWFAINRDRGLPQGGMVAVFDANTGHTLAMLDEQHYLSDIRTAAAGALAARTFAPKGTKTAAVLGAGTQAYWQSQALHHERPFETLLVWARDPARSATLVTSLRERLPEIELRVSSDAESTVREAEIVITATPAREPIIRGDWLRPRAAPDGHGR
jgi:ornithine cyclodeaminase/alanine dehydrogenase-like protein (mu-crystallin family)